MYNLLIALAAGLLAFLLGSLLFSDGDFRPLYGLLPGLGVALGLYLYLARRTLSKVEAIMTRAQTLLSSAGEGNQALTSQRQAEDLMNKAVAITKEAYPYAPWQFLVRPQIDGQIGQLLYMSKRYDEAEPYLKNAMKQHWMAHAMLGTLYYKRKDNEAMKAAFEHAVASSQKESLLWNVYAYCLWKSSSREEAIQVLTRALEFVSKDERTRRNLEALQKKRNMKMRGWNMMWYQFHLDTPPQPKRQMIMKHQRRR